MKHLINYITLIVLLISAAPNAPAQHQYIPIPSDSAFWISTKTHTESPQWTYYFVWYTDGVDTVVAGKWYQGYTGDLGGDLHYGTRSAYFEDWFRQDTIAKKVWKVTDGTNLRTQLFYDFSLQVGDTLTDTTQKIFYRRRPYKFWVSAMDSVYMADSLWHYRWFIHSNFGPDWGFPAAEIVQIEGMGYTTGFMDDPLTIYDPGITEYDQISCFQHNGLWLYSQPNPWNADCDSLMNYDLGGLGIISPETNDLNLPILYPNPATSGSNITLNSLSGETWKNHIIIAFNTQGKQVLRKQLKPGQSFVLPYLPAGLYFFKVMNASGKPIYSTKIFIR